MTFIQRPIQDEEKPKSLKADFKTFIPIIYLAFVLKT